MYASIFTIAKKLLPQAKDNLCSDCFKSPFCASLEARKNNINATIEHNTATIPFNVFMIS